MSCYSSFQVQEKPTASSKQLMLPKKSSTDIRNDKGESLIHQAVKKGDITRVKQLIEEGHSVNTIDHNSWTPLHEVKLYVSIRNRKKNEYLYQQKVITHGGAYRWGIIV
jgi:ankyrin repeat protein